MELKVIDESGQEASSVQVSEVVFGREYNQPLVHQLVVAYQANGRQGTRAQKGRSDVKASTKKPWRQKGTGRARVGMVSSPIWRGGGKIFPSSPEDNFTHKVNKKMYRAGVCSILSQLAREGRLVVLGGLEIDSPKTKALNLKLRGMGLDSVLVVVEEVSDNLYLASRNLAYASIVEPRYADPVSLVHAKKVVVTKAALEKLQEMYS